MPTTSSSAIFPEPPTAHSTPPLESPLRIWNLTHLKQSSWSSQKTSPLNLFYLVVDNSFQLLRSKLLKSSLIPLFLAYPYLIYQEIVLAPLSKHIQNFTPSYHLDQSTAIGIPTHTVNSSSSSVPWMPPFILTGLSEFTLAPFPFLVFFSTEQPQWSSQNQARSLSYLAQHSPAFSHFR